jgi:hypothetical protein
MIEQPDNRPEGQAAENHSQADQEGIKESPDEIRAAYEFSPEVSDVQTEGRNSYQ